MTEKKAAENKVTVDGITVFINQEHLDDMETIELLGRLQDGDILSLPQVMEKLFGKKKYLEIKDKLAENGVTKASAVAEWISKVFTAMEALQAKN